jgi:hypothetical protein
MFCLKKRPYNCYKFAFLTLEVANQTRMTSVTSADKINFTSYIRCGHVICWRGTWGSPELGDPRHVPTVPDGN